MPNKKIFFANNVKRRSADQFRLLNGRVWDPARNGSSYVKDTDSEQKYHPKIQNVIISKKTVNDNPIMPSVTNHVRVVGNAKDFENDEEWHTFINGGIYSIPESSKTKSFKSFIGIGSQYQEFAFDYTVPLEKTVADRMPDSTKIDSFHVNFEYNFYDRDYEIASLKIPDQGSQDNALPNLNLLSFLRSSDEEEMEDNPIADTVFNNSPIMKNQLKKVLKNFDKGKKNPERSKKNFDKFLKQNVASFKRKSLPELKKIANSERDVLFDKSSVLKIIKSNDAKFYMPMYTNLKMTTDDSSVLSEILSETDLMIDFLDYAKDLTQYETQFSGRGTVVDYKVDNLFLEDEKMTRTVGRTNTGYPSFDLLDWWNTVYESEPNSPDPSTTYLTKFRGMPYRTAFDKNYSLVRNLNSIKFLGHLRNYVKTFIKDYNMIFDPNKTKTDTIAYEIKKYKRTQSPDNLLKRYIVPNLDSVKDLDLIDSQISYNKEYVYEVNAICIAVGTSYTYTNLAISTKVADECVELYSQKTSKPVRPRLKTRQVITSKNGKVTYLPMDQNSRYIAEFSVTSKPSLKVFKMPLFSYRARMVDSFSTSPNIEIVNIRETFNEIKIMLSSNSGALFKKPIPFSPSENEQFNFYKRAKNLPLHADVPIHFETDDNPIRYEVFRVDVVPTSYSDFFNKKVADLSTALVSDLSRIATSISFIDKLQFDKKYYYTFRSVDVHGKISYPAPVYEIELVNVSGGVYLEQRVIEFAENVVQDKEKTMRRFIQIVPNLRQRQIQQENLDLTINNPAKLKVNLGLAKEKVWSQNYKLRLTSKLTGKKIDINFTCEHKHLKYTEEET
tara:strand:+ start:4560 stop:7073 length:2514 start_codon:yes stop_codon:yes gene_type:complete